MSEQTYMVDEVVSAMSNLLARWAVPGKLPKDSGADKNGIVCLFSKKQKGLLLFQFVTGDNLHVELEVDLRRLRADGREYLDILMEIVVSQLAAARKEKQKNESIILLPDNSLAPPTPTNVKQAVRQACTAEVLH